MISLTTVCLKSYRLISDKQFLRNLLGVAEERVIRCY